MVDAPTRIPALRQSFQIAHAPKSIKTFGRFLSTISETDSESSLDFSHTQEVMNIPDMAVTLQMFSAPHLEEPSEPSSPEPELTVIEQVSDEDAEDYQQLFSTRNELFDQQLPFLESSSSEEIMPHFESLRPTGHKNFIRKPFQFNADSSDEESIDQQPSSAPANFYLVLLQNPKLLIKQFLYEQASRKPNLPSSEYDFSWPTCIQKLNDGITCTRFLYHNFKQESAFLRLFPKKGKVTCQTKSGKARYLLKNVVGVTLGPVTATLQGVKQNQFEDWQIVSVITKHETMDLATTNETELCWIWTAFGYYAYLNKRSGQLTCRHVNRGDFLVLTSRLKIQKTLKERNLTMNELFMLAMIKTWRDLDMVNRENTLYRLLDRRFHPAHRFFRVVTYFIQQSKLPQNKSAYKRSISDKSDLKRSITKLLLTIKRNNTISQITTPMKPKLDLKSLSHKKLEILEARAQLENARSLPLLNSSRSSRGTPTSARDQRSSEDSTNARTVERYGTSDIMSVESQRKLSSATENSLDQDPSFLSSSSGHSKPLLKQVNKPVNIEDNIVP